MGHRSVTTVPIFYFHVVKLDDIQRNIVIQDMLLYGTDVWDCYGNASCTQFQGLQINGTNSH
jgi:hypothetical protein